MLELNKWFFVLLLNFLVLLYVLNIILFKPLLKLFSDREDSIKDSLNEAKDMEKKKEEALSLMNRDLQDARNKAREIFETSRKDALNKQKALLEAANKEASELLQKASTEMKTEASRARERLRGDVEKLSEEIVRKLIGA